MAQLISRADLARRARVTKAAITKLVAKLRRDHPEAIVADRIDQNHPAVRAYLAGRGVTGAELDRAPTEKPKAKSGRTADPTAKAARAPKVTRVPPAPPPDPPNAPKLPPRQIPLPESLEELGDLADHLRPLIEKYGTSRSFSDWLGSLKVIEEIQAKHLQNQETEGKLISRELVEKHIFGAIDALARALLRDAPKTIARKCWPLAKTGGDIEAGEKIVAGLIAAAFHTMKAQAERALANA